MNNHGGLEFGHEGVIELSLKFRDTRFHEIALLQVGKHAAKVVEG